MDYLESASPSRGSLCAIAHRSRLIPVCLLIQIRLANQAVNTRPAPLHGAFEVTYAFRPDQKFA